MVTDGDQLMNLSEKRWLIYHFNHSSLILKTTRIPNKLILSRCSAITEPILQRGTKIWSHNICIIVLVQNERKNRSILVPINEFFNANNKYFEKFTSERLTRHTIPAIRVQNWYYKTIIIFRSWICPKRKYVFEFMVSLSTTSSSWTSMNDRKIWVSIIGRLYLITCG